MTTDFRWYVVQTQPNSENRADAHLRRQGFLTYLPKISKVTRHARKVETVTRPLFPRYMFILMDTAAQRWRAVQSTIGVNTLLRDEAGPVPLRPGIVEALQDQEKLNGFTRAIVAPFRRGEPVRVMDGLFASRFGLFETMDDNQRASILLELLGRNVRVVLDIQSVAAA